MNRITTLYLIILLEGFAVLSLEILAIRQSLAFVGSGTDTISIIIASVLLPLAFGYYKGGTFKPDRAKKFSSSIRNKLIFNFIISSIFLILAVSYFAINFYFETLIETFQITNRHLLISLYCICLVAPPVYLLGQTIPLTTNYFPKQNITGTTGKILFYSTVGSFLGAVFSPIILMNFISVSFTSLITICSILIATLMLSKKLLSIGNSFIIFLFLVALFLNSPYLKTHLNIISDNTYSTIQLEEISGKKTIQLLKVNNAPSSMIYKDNPEEPLAIYRATIENYYIRPIKNNKKRESILVLGAGGFTLGLNDKENLYTFVDIDPDLKKVSEKFFLKRKLSKNKKFIAKPARSFLIENNEKHDLIIMDVSRWNTGIPEHLITQEYFELVNSRLKDNGVIFINALASALFNDIYSKKLDNTIRSVFPYINRAVSHSMHIWKTEKNYYHPVLYYGKKPLEKHNSLFYTDNKNSASLDKKITIRP
jgi:spermidine synthase